jgi:catechol 2,3-dioxygenase-like lactoylglutathione lyase family enzyme
MVAGTSVVWLPVTDIDRSITFYRDALGLDELQHEHDWAQLDANGLHIGLNATENPIGDGGAVIAFQPESGLESAVQKLRDDGVEIPGDISNHPWGASRPSRIPTATTCSSTSLPANQAVRAGRV